MADESPVSENSGAERPDDTSPAPQDQPPHSQMTDLEIAGVWVVIVSLLFPNIFGRLPPEWVSWVRYSYWEHLSGIIYLFGELALIWFVLWRSSVTWREVGLVAPPRATDVLIVGVIVAGGPLAYSFAVQVVEGGAVSWADQCRQWMRRPVGPLSWSLTTAWLAMAAFTEELLFRGYLFTRMEKSLKSRWWAGAVSSFLFGASHMYQGVTGVVGAALFGALCCVVFAGTRRLWPVAFGHMAFNLMTYVVFAVEPEVTVTRVEAGRLDW